MVKTRGQAAAERETEAEAEAEVVTEIEGRPTPQQLREQRRSMRWGLRREALNELGMHLVAEDYHFDINNMTHHFLRKKVKDFVCLMHQKAVDSAVFLWVVFLLINEIVLTFAPPLRLLRTLSILVYIFMPYSITLACCYMYFVPLGPLVRRMVIDTDIALKLTAFMIIVNLAWASVYNGYYLVQLMRGGAPEDSGSMMCYGIPAFSETLAWNETGACWGLPVETELMEV